MVESPLNEYRESELFASLGVVEPSRVAVTSSDSSAHSTSTVIYVPQFTFETNVQRNYLIQLRVSEIESVSRDGLSAYQIAVNEGYSGTVSEWLESLKGPVGAPGPQGERGPVGAPGPQGKTAYDVAVANGFIGDVTDWLESLKNGIEEAPIDGTPYVRRNGIWVPAGIYPVGDAPTITPFDEAPMDGGIYGRRNGGWYLIPLGIGLDPTPTPPVNLLDIAPGAIAAYSASRKLRSDYIGPAFRVGRSIDTVQQDIGFDDNGDVDIAAILKFASIGEVYVVKWYNQADVDSPLDLVEFGKPKIARDGEVFVGYQSQKPFIRFENNYFQTALGDERAYSEFSCFIVYGIDDSMIPQYPLVIGNTSSATEVTQFGIELGLHSQDNPDSLDIMGHYGHDRKYFANGINEANQDKLISFFLDATIGSAELWKDGNLAQASDVGGFPEKPIKVREKYNVGSNNSGSPLRGRIAEVVIYPDASKARQSDSREIIELNMSDYYSFLGTD